MTCKHIAETVSSDGGGKYDGVNEDTDYHLSKLMNPLWLKDECEDHEEKNRKIFAEYTSETN